MAEPKIGSAAVVLTVDKAQFAAEAKSAIVPGVDAAAKEAGARLASSTTQARGGIQAMINDANKAAEATRAASAAQRAEAASFAATIQQTNTATNTTTPRLRGLGAAAADAGQAFGGAAGEATQLASVLAYGGIAGGAVIGISKLADLGSQMNDTGLDAKELSELVGKEGAQALVDFQGALNFGDAQGDLKKLTESGAAGVGTILNMRDAALAAGQDTSEFDTALEKFNATFNNTNTTVQRGADYIDLLGGSERAAAEEADRLAAAAKRLEAATNNQASAASRLITSQGSVVSAANRVREANERVATFWEESTGKTARQVRDEARAVEDASDRIIDARQAILDAEQDVADAREKLAEAGVHEALAVQDAQDEVDAAQRRLNASTPENREVAQHELDNAKQKLADAKKALEDAKPDAERALDDAVRHLADATKDEQRAVEDLGEAQARQSEQAEKSTKSQQDYQAAIDDANQALFDQAQAVANQKIIQSELATKIKVGPVEAFGILKQALKDVADDLNPSGELAQRILYLLASMTPEGAQQVLKIARPGFVPQFAAGGTAAGGSLFEAAEGNQAELVTRHGLFKAGPGSVDIYNPRETAALLSPSGPTITKTYVQHIHFHGDVDPYKAARTQRRELERFASQPGG